MDQILVYGDSLSWGIIPGTRERFDFHQRWPGFLEIELQRLGRQVRVIEDCLNGRRSVWEDPCKPGRSGIQGLEQRIEANSPLAIAILFLGTNDFQSVHDCNARQSAQGIGRLIDSIRRAPIEPTMPKPEILVIAPPAIRTGKGSMAEKFHGAEAKAKGLSLELQKIAEELNCDFYDATMVASTSEVDGVHLDLSQHAIIGTSLVPLALTMLDRRRAPTDETPDVNDDGPR